jgi:hypothetical protein
LKWCFLLRRGTCASSNAGTYLKTMRPRDVCRWSLPASKPRRRKAVDAQEIFAGNRKDRKS